MNYEFLRALSFVTPWDCEKKSCENGLISVPDTRKDGGVLELGRVRIGLEPRLLRPPPPLLPRIGLVFQRFGCGAS